MVTAAGRRRASCAGRSPCSCSRRRWDRARTTSRTTSRPRIREAGGAAAALARARAARRDAGHPLPDATINHPRLHARRDGRPRRRHAVDLATASRSTRTAAASHRRGSSRRRSPCRRIGRSRRTTRRSRTSPDRRCPPTRRSSGTRACWTCSSSTRSSRIDRDFSIDPALARLGVRVVDGAALPAAGRRRARVRVRRRSRARPARSALAPGGAGASSSSGFLHILDGTDHLLFLLCLVIPFRRFRPLVLDRDGVHGRAFDHADRLGVRPRAGRAVVPAADRNADRHVHRLHGAREHRRLHAPSPAPLDRSRSRSAWCTGLASRSRCGETLQFAGSHLLTSLLSFNVGVELGQLLVLASCVPALQLLFRYVVAERMGTIILSALVAHTAWHWMIDRGRNLSQFDWPALTAAGLASAVRWLTGTGHCRGSRLAGLGVAATLSPGDPKHRTVEDGSDRAALLIAIFNLEFVRSRIQHSALS